MDKDQNNQGGQTNRPGSSQSNKTGSDLPGTSKDPTGRVIGDKSRPNDRSSPNKDRSDQHSKPGRSSYRGPDADADRTPEE